MLARVVRRTMRCTLIDEVMVATTTQSADDDVVRECTKLGVVYFRGGEADVLDRYYRAAKKVRAESVVRITADCPLIEPEVIAQVVTQFQEGRCDYASNALKRTYPRGLDTEVLSFAALARAWCEAKKKYQREHVTPYLYENSQLFRLLSVTSPTDYSSYRWTVDTREDLRFVQTVYHRLGSDDRFSWKQLLALLAKRPELTALNSGVKQRLLQRS